MIVTRIAAMIAEVVVVKEEVDKVVVTEEAGKVEVVDQVDKVEAVDQEDKVGVEGVRNWELGIGN